MQLTTAGLLVLIEVSSRAIVGVGTSLNQPLLLVCDTAVIFAGARLIEMPGFAVAPVATVKGKYHTTKLYASLSDIAR